MKIILIFLFLIGCKEKAEENFTLDISNLNNDRFEGSNPFVLLEYEVKEEDSDVEKILPHKLLDLDEEEDVQKQYCTGTVVTHGNILVQKDCVYNPDGTKRSMDNFNMYVKNPGGDLKKYGISNVDKQGDGWLTLSPDDRKDIEKDIKRAPIRKDSPEVKDLEVNLDSEVFYYDVDPKAHKATLKVTRAVLETSSKAAPWGNALGVISYFSKHQTIILRNQEFVDGSKGGAVFFNKELVGLKYVPLNDRDTFVNWIPGTISLHNY